MTGNLTGGQAGKPMTCFEWQTHSSDYLDGSMIASLKRDADEHVENCRACASRYKHYRLILTSIASQPRSTLPVPIRKSPLSVALPRLDPRGDSGKLSFWGRLPIYARIPLEGAGILLVILVAISSGPRLRKLYERSVEKSLSEFTDSLEVDGNPGDPSGPNGQTLNGGKGGKNTATPGDAPLARGVLPAGGAAVATGSADTDEFSSEGGDTADASGTDESDSVSDSNDEAAGDDTAAVAENVHVGNSEIWRFNFKTDSPHEFRSKIVEILRDALIPPTTPGFGGIEAPGGIQFDLLVPREKVAGLKKSLEQIAPKAPESLIDSPTTPAGETFTWYKNKSKAKIPAGQTRIVIWLSQM